MKKKPLLFCIVVLSFHLSFAQTDYLIPYRDGNKWGFCDTLSRIVIPVQFDNASRFFAGYAQVKIGTQNALIDRRGKVLLKGDFNIETPLGKHTHTNITINNKIGLADVATGKIILYIARVMNKMKIRFD